MKQLFALLIAAVLPFASVANDREGFHAVNLSSLINPAKLATLGKRGANPRIQKAVVILEEAQRDGCQVAVIASNAVVLAGYTNALLAQLTRDGLIRNHDIATKFGVFDTNGIAEMKRGHSPTIKHGRYEGDELSVDHIVPVAAAPELDNVIANLELIPMRLNSAKGDKIGQRQRDLAQKFCDADAIPLWRLRAILGEEDVIWDPARPTKSK